MGDALRVGAALRWSRALVLACVALAFAAAAHAGAGGRLPGSVGLTVLVLVTTAVLASLLGRPASALRVVTLLAGGQAAIHAVFTAIGGHPGAAGGDVTAGEVLGGFTADQHATGPVALPRGAIADVLGTSQLLATNPPRPGPFGDWAAHLRADLSTPANQRIALAHLAAAVAFGLWLAAGERLLWRLVLLLAEPAAATVSGAAHLVARLTEVRIAVLARVRLSLRRPAGNSPGFALPPLWTVLLEQVVVRRGPPAAVVG